MSEREIKVRGATKVFLVCDKCGKGMEFTAITMDRLYKHECPDCHVNIYKSKEYPYIKKEKEGEKMMKIQFGLVLLVVLPECSGRHRNKLATPKDFFKHELKPNPLKENCLYGVILIKETEIETECGYGHIRVDGIEYGFDGHGSTQYIIDTKTLNREKQLYYTVEAEMNTTGVLEINKEMLAEYTKEIKEVIIPKMKGLGWKVQEEIEKELK